MLPYISPVSITKGYTVKKHRLLQVPELEKWKVPLLHSLLSVRAGEFEISFDDKNIDDDDGEEESNMTDDILANICTS